jgi:CDP-diacylglycerol--glycerol-3-phosphate 3-phosphatidyltransferase
MPVVVASIRLSDDDFLTAFTGCVLPVSLFRHGDHLRFAWLLLHRKPFDEALALVRQGIQRFAAHHGASHIYHETLTTAWVKLLATHQEATFEEFFVSNEHRLKREMLYRFWTPEILNSEAAKSGWVPPDKKPLPTTRLGG